MDKIFFNIFIKDEDKDLITNFVIGNRNDGDGSENCLIVATSSMMIKQYDLSDYKCKNIWKVNKL